MAFNEIKRLKEKIEKDPNSKLFVPLAEEYKKAGMYDEAIEVLVKGIERQPHYLSARVSLGKIYIEKGMFDEAKEEFEKVTEVIPDNLYAHKKLAEIYKQLGNKEKTLEELKIVLKINPTDEWASAMLTSIQSEIYEEKYVEAEPLKVEEGEKAKEEGLDVQEEPVEMTEESIEEEIKEEIKEEILEEKIETEEQISEKEARESIIEEIGEHEEVEAKIGKIEDVGEVEEFEGETKEEDLWEALAEELQLKGEKDVEKTSSEPKVAEESAVSDEMESATEESFSFDDVFTKKETEDMIVIEEEPITEEITKEEITKEEITKEEITKEEITKEEITKEEITKEETTLDDISKGIKYADELILKDSYVEAMKIYKDLLSREPENRNILQRIEELKALLKLLGKDKEALIEKLENFLKGIKKRQDEFYRGA